MWLSEMKNQGRALHDLPLVVIEVSETTLRYDRVRKGSLYASREIQDYWIINIPDDQVEVYRSPVKDAQASFGWKYEETHALKRGDKLELLAAPGKIIDVSRLLP